MIKYVNLQFFKGGTEVQEVDKRQPKSEQLKAMDTGMYNVFGGIMDRYGGVSLPSGASLGSGGVGGGTKIQRGSFLDSAFNTADLQAALTNANINELLAATPEYLRKHENFLDNGTDAGFENYVRATEDALANTYSKNVGTDINSLNNRGILNSSVTNRALANQQAEIGDAVAKNRNEAANVYLQNYLNGYNTGMEGLKTQTELIPTYYTNALSPLMPAYKFWKDSTDAWLADDRDYVATSSGK